MNKRSALNFLLFPVTLSIFLLNFHFYQFYKSTFLQNFKNGNYNLLADNYKKIQKENPYYAIYPIIASNKQGVKKQVFYLFQNIEDRNLDYTQTYYSGKKAYLTELGAVINYYSYPKLIKQIRLPELLNLKLKTGDLIITDKKLSPEFSQLTKLSLIHSQNGFYKNRLVDEFFIYQKIK